MFLDPLYGPMFAEEVLEFSEVIKQTPFRDVGDLFTFIGLLVAIGGIGVYAIYRIVRMFFYND